MFNCAVQANIAQYPNMAPPIMCHSLFQQHTYLTTECPRLPCNPAYNRVKVLVMANAKTSTLSCCFNCTQGKPKKKHINPLREAEGHEVPCMAIGERRVLVRGGRGPPDSTKVVVWTNFQYTYSQNRYTVPSCRQSDR